MNIKANPVKWSRGNPATGTAYRLPPPQVWLGPVFITGALWLTSANSVNLLQGAMAFLMLLLPWWSYQQWRESGSQGLPLFAAATLIYWLYFSLQLFWGDRGAIDWRHRRNVSDAAVTEAMLLVAFGVAFLWLGTRSTLGRRMAFTRFPEISLTPWNILYVQGVAIAGTVMSRYQNLTSAGGEGLRQVIMILEGTSSMAAVLILVWRVLDGKAARFEKILLVGILGSRVVLGVSSGWVGSTAGLGLSCGFLYLFKHRRLPLAFFACVLPYVLFFQAGKLEFRRVFWHDQVEASAIEKSQFWVDASLKAWQQALEDPSGRRLGYLLSSSLSRTSLLTQAANVLEQTPAVVPYQNGRLYSYLLVALIPRYLWPEKPSMNDANRFYQVAYGLTRERDLNNVSIAVGSLTEGYINFGWLGTAMVMFFIGMLLDFWNETFLSRSAGALALGIGVAMLPQLVAVETQMAQYVSGILQNVILTVMVFIPAMRLRGMFSPASTAALGMARTAPAAWKTAAPAGNR